MRGDDGLYAEVNLFKVPSIEHTIALGFGNEYELAVVRFYPIEPGPPPSGFAVLDGRDATANIWRCVQSAVDGGYCASIGQAKYGLTFANDSVITATYGKGYGGASTQVRFVCGLTLKEDEFVFHSTGTIGDDWAIVFDLRGGAFCPRDDYTVKKLRGGAVFLIIVLSVVVVYVCGGVLLKPLMGKIEMPNAEFWSEVRQSVVAALAFVWSCGKKRPDVEAAFKPV
jgi:hypothetical protein